MLAIRRSLLVASVAGFAFLCLLAEVSSANPYLQLLERVGGVENQHLDIDFRDDKRVDVDIAILDTGVDLHDPDVNVVAGIDCMGATPPAYTCTENASSLSGPQGEDTHGHGANSARIAAALDNDLDIGGVGAGVGAAPGARVWAIEVTSEAMFSDFLQKGKSAAYDLDPLIAGVRWVTAHAEEIEVATIVIGCTTEPEPAPKPPRPVCASSGHGSVAEAIEELREAIAESVDEGVVYTSAAGNWNSNLDPVAFEADLEDALDPEFEGIPFSTHAYFVPAVMDDVITASSVIDTDGAPGGAGLDGEKCLLKDPKEPIADVDDTSSDSSGYGPGIDIAGPGACASGVAPIIAGGAALLASISDPGSRAGVESIREDLIEKGNSAWIDESGDGIQEPYLDLSDESTFDPKTIPGTDDGAVDSDVNGDGRADLVTLRADGVASVHPGGTDLKFGSATTSFSGSPLNVAQYDGTGHYVVDVADVNADSRSDLVTLTDDGDVHVYPGGEGKTFGSAVDSDLNLGPALLEAGGHEPIAVADVNGDRHADLVAYDDEADAVIVYPGKANASFGTGAIAQSEIASALHAGTGHYFLDVADVTGDGRGDLVSMTSGGDLNVFAGRNGATFAAPTVSHAGQIDTAMDDEEGFEPVALGDSTGDGHADLVLLDNTEDTLFLYPGAVDGTFGTVVEAWPYAVLSTTFDKEPASRNQFAGVMDVNGDDKADLTGAIGGSVFVIKGQANGTFAEFDFSFGGSFATTQHGQAGSTKHEMAAEKPSWKRRGGTPGNEPLFTVFTDEFLEEGCPAITLEDNEVSGGCVAEDLDGSFNLGAFMPNWTLVGVYDSTFDLVLDRNGDGYAVKPSINLQGFGFERVACDESDGTVIPWEVDSISPDEYGTLEMTITVGLRPLSYGPGGSCTQQEITVQATAIGGWFDTELDQGTPSANIKDGHWDSPNSLWLEWL